MGKKSRHKKNKQHFVSEPQTKGAVTHFSSIDDVHHQAQTANLTERILIFIVKLGVYLSFLTPFILFNEYYFPFVGSKSLYFMAACQVVFFAWLILAFLNKRYRPRFNAVLGAFIIFIAVLIVSAVVGVDFSQSFWSKFERMTGLLIWLHLFGFLVAVSSTIKEMAEWKKIFVFTVLISMVVSVCSVLEVVGIKVLRLNEMTRDQVASNGWYSFMARMIFSDRGGFTLGNTSFLGSYLIFNIFLALYLFFSPNGLFKAKKITWALRIYGALGALLGIVALYYNEARAALFAAVSGLGFILLLWLSFAPSHDRDYRRLTRWLGRIMAVLILLAVAVMFLWSSGPLNGFLSALKNYQLEIAFYIILVLVLAAAFWLALSPVREARFTKITKRVSRVLLVVALIAVVASLALLLIPNNPVHDTFGKMGGAARFVNWDIAWKGFLERPLLGWGPENYILVFPKYFNTCLFIPEECGGEIWFDRAHNIVFDNLVTIGLVGLVAYLGLFVTIITLLFKKYYREKSIDFWSFAILSVCLLAYFIQNLTVFDMVVSLMMFVLTLSFAAFLAQQGKKAEPEAATNKEPSVGLIVSAGLLFMICFLIFIVQPFRADHYVIKAMQQDLAVTQEVASLARQLGSEKSLSQSQEVSFVKFVLQRSQDRLNWYQQTLGSSPLGKYQIREFFAQQFESSLQNPSYASRFNLSVGAQYTIWSYSTTTFDYLIKELEKSWKESPNDYRSLLRLGDILSLYGKINPEKFAVADQVLKAAMKLSPDNQQTYWLLVQNNVWIAQEMARNGNQSWPDKIEESLQQAYKSRDLNERVWNSNQIILQVLAVSRDLAIEQGRNDLAKKYGDALKQEKEEMVKINKAWAQNIEQFQ